MHFPARWGPPPQCQFPAFDALPFRAFNRGTKIGKVADFGGFLRFQTRARGYMRSQGEQHSELDLRADGQVDGDDGEGYTRVDTTSKVVRPNMMKGGGRGRGGFRGGRGGGREEPGAGGRAQYQMGTSFNKRFNKLTRARYVSGDNFKGGQGQRLIREFSVKVQPDWLQLETLELSKVRFGGRGRRAPCVCGWGVGARACASGGGERENESWL